MNGLVDELIQEASALSTDGVCIRRSSDLPPVMCREHLIRELLRNLLENAVKYRGDRAAEIEIGAQPGDIPVFFVRDNGVGIHEADLSRVLSPLTRADGDSLNAQGTGMGLALVRAIVERHEGRLHLESERGRGTTVWFSLSEQDEAADLP